jgi:hypothetical protein
MNDTVTILVTHQSPVQVGRMLEWWERHVLGTQLLIAYGGPQERFHRISALQKIFVTDQRIRTTDHVRERQSYTGVFQEASKALKKSGFQYIWLVEYDHIPIARHVLDEFKQRMTEASADVLCYCLRRIDRTISPHFLGHANNPAFFQAWRNISVREEKDVILSMFVSGSLWRRCAFEAIAAREEPFPTYVELYLPTMAHHLGFRLVDLGTQSRFIKPGPSRSLTFESAKAQGALTAHPLKRFWDSGRAKQSGT